MMYASVLYHVYMFSSMMHSNKLQITPSIIQFVQNYTLHVEAGSLDGLEWQVEI